MTLPGFIMKQPTFLTVFFEMSPFGETGVFTESGLFPKLDVTESDKNVTVKADIPGIDRKSRVRKIEVKAA